MKREGVGCRAFAVDEGEIRERNSLPARIQLENNFSRKNGRCINPRNPRVREGKRAGKLLVPAPFLNFRSPLPPKNQQHPPLPSLLPLFFFSCYDTTYSPLFLLQLFSFLFFPFHDGGETRRMKKARGEACFFCFDALPGTGIRLQFLKKTRHTAFFNLPPTSSGFSKQRERERETSFCLSGEPLIPSFSPRPHARNYHDFRFFARPLPAPTRMIFPSRSFLPPF